MTGAPAFKAIAPAFTSIDNYESPWYGPGGALSLSLVTWWNAMMYAADAQRSLAAGEGSVDQLQQLGQAALFPETLNDVLPTAEVPVLAAYGKWWDACMAHPSHDGYWDAMELTPELKNVTAPALNIGGWYDLYIGQTLRTYTTARQQASCAQVRDGQRLIDQWRDEQEWPLPDTRWTDYHLTSGDRANTADGDGALTTESPSGVERDTYLYDPRRPVPRPAGRRCRRRQGSAALSTGGPSRAETTSCASRARSGGGCRGDRSGEPDLVRVLVYGDTDFTAKLVDVFADGRAFNLCDGILRARYRNGLATEEFMEPGTVYEITIDMTATSNVFLPGRRIRVDVSSSNFPSYDRNTNTGGVIARTPAGNGPAPPGRLHRHDGLLPNPRRPRPQTPRDRPRRSRTDPAPLTHRPRPRRPHTRGDRPVHRRRDRRHPPGRNGPSAERFAHTDPSRHRSAPVPPPDTPCHRYPTARRLWPTRTGLACAGASTVSLW